MPSALPDVMPPLKKKKTFAQHVMKKLEFDIVKKKKTNLDWVTEDNKTIKKPQNLVDVVVRQKSSIMLYVFLLVITETGDKSQLTTFAISVNYNWKEILLGGAVAHIFSTTLAICMNGAACSESCTNLIESILYLIAAIFEIVFGITYNIILN
jgi:putative Ca2+/H+ antiporter (TMEM165/GDT1 family)